MDKRTKWIMNHYLHIVERPWLRNWFMRGSCYWLTRERALAALVRYTGQNFGYDVKRWRRWMRENPEFKIKFW